MLGKKVRRKLATITADALVACNQEADEEIGHKKADAILVRFVRELGYEDVARSFEHVRKWYA